MKTNKPFSFKNTKGVEYEISFRKPDKRAYGDADGVCYPPEDKHPKIFINPNLTSQNELNTIIHELAHAFFWDKSERAVERFASTCSHFLWNNRWRKFRR